MQPCEQIAKIAQIEWKILKYNEITILNMKNIEKEISRVNETLNNFINKADNKYATKFEMKANEERINEISNIFKRLNWILVTFTFTAILVLIFK